jgi:hypothetical protein
MGPGLRHDSTFNTGRITTRNEKDKQILSWLCKGTFKHYKPVAIWHKIMIALLLVCFLGVNGWLAKDFWGVYRIHRLILAEKSKSCEEHLPEMGLVIKRCFECKDDKGEVLSFYRLYDNNKPKDKVVTIGISFYPGEDKGQCPVDTLFYVVDYQKLSSVFAYIPEYLGDLNAQSEILLRYFYTAEVDLTLIKDLKNLIYLNLDSNKVSDVSQLKDLKNLTYLNLSLTQVSDVSALKDLKNLTYLSLYSTQVSDVSALKDLKNLTYLILQQTKISDLSPLKGLKVMKRLSLSFNHRIHDLRPLKKLNNLNFLDLRDTNIVDLTPIKNLKNLTYLSLSGTSVSDLAPIKDLKKLIDLYLECPKVSNLKPLKNLKNLTYLDLRYTQLSDVSALKDLKNLTYLDLRYTQVSDVSALKDLKNLKKLYLSEEQQENLKTQIQQLKKALPELQIKKY